MQDGSKHEDEQEEGKAEEAAEAGGGRVHEGEGGPGGG